MKILFVTTCFPSSEAPQYCVFLKQQATALVKLGNCVDVLYLREGNYNNNEYILDGIKIIEYPLASPKRYEVVLPTSLAKSDCRNILELVRGNYDVVSFHFGGTALKRSVIKICKKANIPFVLHFHGLNVWYEQNEKYKLLYEWYRIQYKRLYKKCAAVVGVSDKVCEQFREKIHSVPYYTVYNGVNIEKFNFKDRKDLNSPIRILCVANLIKLKGQEFLIKAVACLIEEKYECKLTLVGDGPEKARLEDFSNTLGISDKVSFTGALEYDRVAELMGENDIFIMPSYYEALGCVYLEAMSSGMITVGVIGQGIDEIIKNGNNGFLVEPKRVDDIVGTVKKISVLDGDKLSDISHLARKTAEDYTWEKSAECLNEVYIETVSRFTEGKN